MLQLIIKREGSFFSRNCFPDVYYGMDEDQALRYAKQHSKSLFFYTPSTMLTWLWRVTETGNDILLGQFRNGEQIASPGHSRP